MHACRSTLEDPTLDIATIAHCKIGNGSAWQGYYMYAGGTNPPGDHGMQESHATGYPNDMQRLGYDFHAPVGEAGLLAESHAALRSQHAFLAAFGSSLAEMPSSLPFVRPSGVDDAETLRWALRSDGRSGFLFVAWHQPHVPLPVYRGAQFSVQLDGSTVELPAAPVDIPPGTLARWPIGLSLGGVCLDWATASALTVLPGAVPTLVLVAEAGIEVSYSVGDVVATVEPGLSPVRLRQDGGELDLLVLPAAVAAEVWVCSVGDAAATTSAAALASAAATTSAATAAAATAAAATAAAATAAAATAAASAATASASAAATTSATASASAAATVSAALSPGRRLLLSPDELSWGPSGRIESSGPRVQVYDPAARGFRQLTLEGTLPDKSDLSGGVGAASADAGSEAAPPSDPAHKSDLSVISVRPAGTAVPVAYGKFDGRQSAPSAEAFDELAAVYEIPLPGWATDGSVDTFLHLRWAGDVGQLRVDGRTVTDRFWDGSEWIVNLRDAGVRSGSALTLHLLPLAAGSTISLPADARDRLAAADGQLLAIDSLHLRGRAVWREPHRVRRAARRMSDGREIVYFDDTPPFREREAVDVRPLPTAAAGPEMRRDPLTGEWITIAAHRNDRTFLPSPDQDPLAPTTPGGFPTEIAEPAYDVVVFENRFPSFSSRASRSLGDLAAAAPAVSEGGASAGGASAGGASAGGASAGGASAGGASAGGASAGGASAGGASAGSASAGGASAGSASAGSASTGSASAGLTADGHVDGDPLWPVRPASGRTEVVVFSSAPKGSFGSLTPHRARTVIEAWTDRTAVLNASPDVEYVFPFENRGREIGVTLPHPHGQIYAFPFVPPKAARMLEMARAHQGGNLFRDILDAERRAGTRIVATSAHWTAYVPAASRWPLEVHLAPHRDVPDLPALTSAERDDLALIYLDLLGRLDRYFPGVDELPYISGVFQAPARADRDLFRLHIQVFSILRAPGKLKYLAGVESAMAAWINDTRPETVAARLRSLA